MSAPASEPEVDTAEGGTDFTRIFNFSDGVFSIAVTLLAFDVKVPEVSGELHAEALASALMALGPKALVYALSFLVIGLFWMAHHRMFRSLVRFDSTVLWLNNLHLLFVAFLPVASVLLGRDPGEPLAVRIYCASVAAPLAILLWIWRYATQGRRLTDPALSTWVVRIQLYRTGLTIVACAICAGLCSWSARAAVDLLFVYTVLSFPLGYVYRMRLWRRVGVRT